MLPETHSKWVLFLLVLPLAACPMLRGVLDSETELVYANYTSEYFSVHYPETWLVEESEEEDMDSVIFRSRRENKEDTILESFAISFWEGMENFEELERSERRRLFEGEHVTVTERTVWQEQEVLTIESEGLWYGEGPETVHYRVLFIPKGGWVYRMEYAMEKGKEEKFIPIMDKMLESLQLTPPAPRLAELPEIAAGSGGSEPVAYTLYSSSDFSMEHPENWEVEETNGITRITEFISPLESATDNMQEVFSVEVWEGNATLQDLRVYERSLLYVGETITQEGAFTFNGSYDAIYIVTERQQETGEWIFYRAMYFVQGGRIYRIVYAYDREKADKYGPMAGHMLESLVPR